MNQVTKKINQKDSGTKKKHTFKKFWTFSKDCFSCFLRSFFLCDERSLLDGDSYKAQECPRSFLLWRKFLSQIFGILYLGDKSLCLFYYVWSSLVWNSIHIYLVFDHLDQCFICPKPNNISTKSSIFDNCRHREITRHQSMCLTWPV